MAHVPTLAFGKHMHAAMNKGKEKLVGKAQMNEYPRISLLFSSTLEIQVKYFSCHIDLGFASINI